MFNDGMINEIYSFDIEAHWFSTGYKASYGIFALKKSADGKSVSCMLAIYSLDVERALRWWQIFTRSRRELGFRHDLLKDYVRYHAIEDFKKNRVLNGFLNEASKRELSYI